MPPIKPLGERIMVEQDKSDLLKKAEVAGIQLSENADRDDQKLPKGVVLAVGTGPEALELNLKEGDVVFFNPFAGERLTHEGKEYLLLRPSEVLAQAV